MHLWKSAISEHFFLKERFGSWNLQDSYWNSFHNVQNVIKLNGNFGDPYIVTKLKVQKSAPELAWKQCAYGKCGLWKASLEPSLLPILHVWTTEIRILLLGKFFFPMNFLWLFQSFVCFFKVAIKVDLKFPHLFKISYILSVFMLPSLHKAAPFPKKKVQSLHC